MVLCQSADGTADVWRGGACSFVRRIAYSIERRVDSLYLCRSQREVAWISGGGKL